MLTDDQKTVLNLTNDINRLTEQRDAIQSQVDKLAKQHDEFYVKRNEAAREFELKLQETKGIEEKIRVSRSELEQKKRELDKRDRDLVIKEQKLSSDKEAFRAERRVYESKEIELSERIKDIDKREAGLIEKEKKLEAREENILIRESQSTQDVSELRQKLESEIASLEVIKKEYEEKSSSLTSKKSSRKSKEG